MRHLAIIIACIPFVLSSTTFGEAPTPPQQSIQQIKETGEKSFYVDDCDTSQWFALAGATQSPVPACTTTRAASKISILYPGVVGIGDPSGARVPINDQRYLQRAQHLVQAKTALDNTKQESALGVNFTSQTGGGGLPDTNHNQKVALSVLALAIPGASNTWAINTDLHVNEGVGNYSMYGREADHTNFNGEYVAGGCNPCGPNQINGNFIGDFLTFTGYPITAGVMMTGNPNVGSANMQYGIIFQSTPGFHEIGTGLIKSATINDSSNSSSSYMVYGNHTVGFNTTMGNVPVAVAMAAGQKTCFNALESCLSYDKSNKLLNYGNSILLHDSGQVTLKNLVESQSFTPPNSNYPCTLGQHAWDKNYEYRCIASNTWRRAALSAF